MRETIHIEEQADAHVYKYWQTRFLRRVKMVIPKDKPKEPAKVGGVAHVA